MESVEDLTGLHRIAYQIGFLVRSDQLIIELMVGLEAQR